MNFVVVGPLFFKVDHFLLTMMTSNGWEIVMDISTAIIMGYSNKVTSTVEVWPALQSFRCKKIK